MCGGVDRFGGLWACWCFFCDSEDHYAAEAFDGEFVRDVATLFLEISEDSGGCADVGCPLASFVVGSGFQVPLLCLNAWVVFEAEVDIFFRGEV